MIDCTFIKHLQWVCKSCFYACLAWVFIAFTPFWPAGASVFDVSNASVNHFLNQLVQLTWSVFLPSLLYTSNIYVELLNDSLNWFLKNCLKQLLIQYYYWNLSTNGLPHIDNRSNLDHWFCSWMRTFVQCRSEDAKHQLVPWRH